MMDGRQRWNRLALGAAVLTLILAGLLVSSQPRVAHANTVNVCDSGCSYTSLSAAVLDFPNLPASSTYTVTLAADEFHEIAEVTINIDAAVTIRGAGATSTTLTTDGADRIINYINAGASSHLTIEDITLSNGSTAGNGGAVQAAGPLTVRRSVFDGNDATGGASRAGAIFASSSLTVEDSVFSSNSSAFATGAIHIGGQTLIERSLFSGNTATAGGSAIDRPGAAAGTATIRASSFVGHAAPAIDANAQVDVHSTWWGGGAPGAQINGAVTSHSHVTGLDAQTSNPSPVVGGAVTITATPALNTGSFAPDSLTMEVSRTGANPGTTTASGAGSASALYAGGNSGTDTVTAKVLWGGQPGTGSELSDIVTVTWGEPPPPPPQAVATSSAGVGVEGDTLTFDASGSSGTYPLSFAWDFGDGQTGAGASATHTFEDDGTFAVSVTVTGGLGRSSSGGVSVTITNAPPTVEVDIDATVQAGRPFALAGTFDDPGALDAPWQFDVDWGDGARTTGEVLTLGTVIAPEHTYAAGGPRTVTLCLADKDGDQGCASVTVAVANPPATPTPSPTPIATPVAPTSTPTPTAATTSTPAATGTPTATPTAIPTAAVTGTPGPTATPVASVSPAAPTPAGTPGGVATAEAQTTGPEDAEDGGSNDANGAPASLAPGAPVAALLAAVDTSRTPGGREVSPEVAESRAAIRRVSTAGASFLGGTVPWYAAQSIDQRSVAGALVSGGAFLPFLFAGGGPAHTPSRGPDTPQGDRVGRREDDEQTTDGEREDQ